MLPSAAAPEMRTLAPAVMVRTTRDRRALLVGINDYPNPDWRLNGCVNDVYLMSAVLQECGFAAETIRVLTDRRATRAAILERLDWLSDGVRDGDERVFYYSGHGAQMPITGASGEPDRQDETLVPADFDWSEEHAFRDKEFAAYYGHLPYGANFMAMFDCCHAGGMTKGSMRVRGIDPPDDIRHRTLRWNPKHQMWVPRDFVETDPKDGVRPTRSFSAEKKGLDRHTDRRQRELGTATSRRPESARQFERSTQEYGNKGPYMPVLIYAARQDELAAEYDHGSVAQGAFTFCMVKQLRAKPRNPPTFEGLVKSVRGELLRLGYQQTPEIAGPEIKITQKVPMMRWKTNS